MARRARVEPTEDWEQIKLLLKFPEQLEYERIRPPVVFGASVAERSRQTKTPESTLHRKISGFEKDGMRSLFETERVEPRGGASLDPEVRRLILDLKQVMANSPGEHIVDHRQNYRVLEISNYAAADIALENGDLGASATWGSGSKRVIGNALRLP